VQLGAVAAAKRLALHAGHAAAPAGA
jgi:hypothetical protein